MDDFNRWSGVLNTTEYKRAMHAVSENERAVAFFKTIRERNFEGSGELLYASHESLRDRYEVSISEMDAMVEWTRGMDGVFGARMMGGGFGGCTINMVRADRVREFKAAMRGLFRGAFGKEPEMTECTIDDGVREEVL
jgi:galactokinase